MKRKLIWVFLAAAVIAVWIHSVLPGAVSGQESGWFTEHIVNPVWRFLFGKPISEAIVRKLAHVLEYAVVGMLLGAAFRRNPVCTFGLGMFIAVIDETIQIFSGRGPMISDLWIDLGGVAIGYGLAWAIHTISCRICGSKNKSVDKPIDGRLCRRENGEWKE